MQKKRLQQCWKLTISMQSLRPTDGACMDEGSHQSSVQRTIQHQKSNNSYSSSNSTSCALLSAAFFLIKKPHLIAALIFNQPTTALPLRPRSSSKPKLGDGDGMYGGKVNPSSGPLTEAWFPMLQNRSKCCISSLSSISWLLMRISSSDMKSSVTLSWLFDQSSKGFRLAFWTDEPMVSKDDDWGGPSANPVLLLWIWWELLICWSWKGMRLLSNWARELELTNCDWVGYLAARSSL